MTASKPILKSGNLVYNRTIQWVLQKIGRVGLMVSQLEQVYPQITLWIKTHGWIEIGHDDYIRSFIKALDEGGMVWEGSNSYETLDEALAALEAGLIEWMSQVG